MVLSALAAAAALGLYVAAGMSGLLMGMMMEPLGFAYVAVLLAMWWSMMMAMMLPSVAPAVLVYGALRRNYVAKGLAQPPLPLFVAGYAAVWTAFSLLAVAFQLLMKDAIRLNHMYATASVLLGGALLISAGTYQLTPLKKACLRRCQAPAFYIARHWRNTATGVFGMGLSHGVYCLGCCWVLMLLLFYGGAMNPAWIVGLAAYVAVEKLWPVDARLARFTGIALILWGSGVVFQAL